MYAQLNNTKLLFASRLEREDGAVVQEGLQNGWTGAEPLLGAHLAAARDPHLQGRRFHYIFLLARWGKVDPRLLYKYFSTHFVMVNIILQSLQIFVTLVLHQPSLFIFFRFLKCVFDQDLLYPKCTFTPLLCLFIFSCLNVLTKCILYPKFISIYMHCFFRSAPLTWCSSCSLWWAFRSPLCATSCLTCAKCGLVLSSSSRWSISWGSCRRQISSATARWVANVGTEDCGIGDFRVARPQSAWSVLSDKAIFHASETKKNA